MLNLQQVLAYRESGRDAEERDYGHRPGGCSWTSEWVERTFGLSQDGGCYVPTDGERHAGQHVAHLWNRLPDGRIFDATADQFVAMGGGVRFTDAGDRRYLPGCDGEACNDGAGAR